MQCTFLKCSKLRFFIAYAFLFRGSEKNNTDINLEQFFLLTFTTPSKPQKIKLKKSDVKSIAQKKTELQSFNTRKTVHKHHLGWHTGLPDFFIQYIKTEGNTYTNLHLNFQMALK
jgi:hypothetical protein